MVVGDKTRDLLRFQVFKAVEYCLRSFSLLYRLESPYRVSRMEGSFFFFSVSHSET